MHVINVIVESNQSSVTMTNAKSQISHATCAIILRSNAKDLTLLETG